MFVYARGFLWADFYGRPKKRVCPKNELVMRLADDEVIILWTDMEVHCDFKALKRNAAECDLIQKFWINFLCCINFVHCNSKFTKTSSSFHRCLSISSSFPIGNIWVYLPFFHLQYYFSSCLMYEPASHENAVSSPLSIISLSIATIAVTFNDIICVIYCVTYINMNISYTLRTLRRQVVFLWNIWHSHASTPSHRVMLDLFLLRNAKMFFPVYSLNCFPFFLIIS